MGSWNISHFAALLEIVIIFFLIIKLILSGRRKYIPSVERNLQQSVVPRVIGSSLLKLPLLSSLLGLVFVFHLLSHLMKKQMFRSLNDSLIRAFWFNKDESELIINKYKYNRRWRSYCWC